MLPGGQSLCDDRLRRPGKGRVEVRTWPASWSGDRPAADRVRQERKDLGRGPRRRGDLARATTWARGDTGKIVPLDWKPPFAAQWRVDWRQADRLTGSWEMIVERKSGEFEKYGWFGKRRHAAPQPPALEHGARRLPVSLLHRPAGPGVLQPLGGPCRFEGPAVIYPINRVRATPLDRFTRWSTWCVRPSAWGRASTSSTSKANRLAMRGRATCATPDGAQGDLRRDAAEARRAEIEKILRTRSWFCQAHPRPDRGVRLALGARIAGVPRTAEGSPSRARRVPRAKCSRWRR